MKKIAIAFVAFIVLCSHDMYLKMDTYFLRPETDATIQLYNGTFERSDNVIDRDRMTDASLVGNSVRSRIDTTQWSEKDSITFLNFRTGKEGTWVAGVSTAPRVIEMTAKDFNNYLEHDGVLDMLEQRQNNDELNDDAAEKYSKHVKIIFQVGEEKTDDWQTELGYPLEFIPLSNPYGLYTGDSLKIKLLSKGEPLSNQLVYADYSNSGKGHAHAHGDDGTAGQEHSHDTKEEEDHQHTSGMQLRTDSQGIINIKLKEDGIWYLRTINLVKSEEERLTHESNWATLTFEVTHSHGEDSHTHSHSEEGGIPSYVYWIGSFVLLGGLFLWFNRKK